MKYVVLVRRSESDPSVPDGYSVSALGTACTVRSDGDTVTAVTMGQSDDVLRFCLDRGADNGFLLRDDAFAWADTSATSRTLAAFIRKFVPDYDLIVCGKESRTGQVPAEIAGMLGVQQFCYVIRLEVSSGFEVIQDYGDELRRCRVPRGSVLSVSEGPEAEISGKISDYDIRTLDRVALGLGVYSVGMKGSKTRVVKTSGEAV